MLTELVKAAFIPGSMPFLLLGVIAWAGFGYLALDGAVDERQWERTF